MITLLNKSSLLSTFGANDIDALKSTILNMAPSMVEYYLCNLSISDDTKYLNKKNIEETISIGDFNIHIDYDNEYYLEINSDSQYEETGSLW